MTARERLEARCRRLLRCYPRRWRERHEDEMVGVLLDTVDARGGSAVGIATSLDLIGHGLEERLDWLTRGLPERSRRRTASAALVVAAVLSLLLLVGELVVSGSILTTGVALHLAVMTSALLVVWSRPGLARVLLLAATAYAGWMLLTTGGEHPAPRAAVLVMFVGLGLLASLATLELDRPARHGLVKAGALFALLLAAGLLLTRPLLRWSVGTITSSGNVAAAALAVVLAVLGGAAILLAASLHVRRPGWAAPLAVTALPIVSYCSAMSVSVNPIHTLGRSLIPLAYLLVVGCVAVLDFRRKASQGMR